MSDSIETKNPILKGLKYTVIIISYCYYIGIGGDYLTQHYFPKYYLGFIVVGLTPFAIALIIHLTGIYEFSFKLSRKISTEKDVVALQQEFHLQNDAQNDPYGIVLPILNYKSKLEEILKSISEKHFSINDELVIELYKHGLEKVNERFWTTTYLSSGFWTHGRTDVINANIEMLNRLLSKENKSIRRVFLLKNPLLEEIRLIGANVAELKNQGLKGENKIQQLFDEFEILKKICSDFQKKGCEIKFFFDSIDHASIGITKYKTEIALYDNLRIDYFDGGEDAEIKGVNIFHEKHKSFNDKKVELTNYFELLWKKSHDINILFEKLEHALKYYSEKIDYSYPRLIQFDYNLNLKDKNLKDEEFAIVSQHLEKENKVERIIEYLDIGTCTGRYPFGLSKKLSKANILGIDADADCIEFCNIQKQKFAKSLNTKNILFSHTDVLYDNISNTKFDLVTCMLGTISHFGWNKNINFEDDLQLTLKKISLSLNSKGTLIIGNWTDFGLSGNILEIYNDFDRTRLRNFTEKTETLIKRLEFYFNLIEVIRTKDNNIDIIICEKK